MGKGGGLLVYQRARVNWLKMGDSNTKFFHQSTMQRRQKNKVLWIRGRQ